MEVPDPRKTVLDQTGKKFLTILHINYKFNCIFALDLQQEDL